MSEKISDPVEISYYVRVIKQPSIIQMITEVFVEINTGLILSFEMA